MGATGFIAFVFVVVAPAVAAMTRIESIRNSIVHIYNTIKICVCASDAGLICPNFERTEQI